MNMVFRFSIESILGVRVKRIQEFHSHVEVLQDLDSRTLHKQVCLYVWGGQFYLPIKNQFWHVKVADVSDDLLFCCSFEQQITIGFGTFSIKQPNPPDKYPPVFFRGTPTENRVSIPNATFSATEDPTRFVPFMLSVTEVSRTFILKMRYLYTVLHIFVVQVSACCQKAVSWKG